MKKNVGLMVVLLVVLTMTMQAFALDCSISYNAATNQVNLKGSAKAPVSVLILPEEVSPETIDEENAVAATQYQWRGVTEFDETILLDKNLPSGTYHVMLKSNEQYMVTTTEEVNEKPARIYGTITDNIKTVSGSLYHINIDDGREMVADLNTVKTDAEALCDMIATGKTGEEGDPEESRVPYTELIGVTPEGFAQFGAYVSEQMVSTKDGEDFTDIQDVIDLMNEYRVLYQAINSSDPSQVISQNAAFYTADVARFVTALDELSTAKLNVLLQNFKADGRSLSEELPELSALAVVQGADRWQTIETVVTDSHEEIVNIDYDVDNRDKVFQQMMDYTYDTFLDIADNFAKANSEVNKVTYKPVVRPSGGGGGGGGGSFEIAPSRPEQREEEVDAKTFSDVPENFWGKDAISQLAAKNVISGYPDGSFRPEGNVTRAEFVKMLTTAFGLATAAEIPFSDVTASDWYYNYIRTAYASGIISGSGNGAFNPDGEITREDACVIVYRYLSGIGVLDATKATFADQGEFASYAQDAIATLAGNGIVNGVGNNRFDGKASINRASCAVLILNCLNK